LFAAFSVSAGAQWINQPIPGAPRNKDGTVNMTAPAPRVNGKADISGLWQVEGEARAAGGLFGLGEYLNSKYFRNVVADYKPGEEPLTELGRKVFAVNSKSPLAANPSVNCLPDGVPHADLLPEPFKIIQTPGVIIVLYEVETTFRQIFMDGRKLPTDPSPAWMGYSIGRWEGETLVVNSAGFNDRSWLDAFGHGHSEDLRVEERFTRRDYGHLELAVTMTDPKYFTKPVSFKVTLELMPDTDVFEHYCIENERDAGHQ
jgi:hypothetical protein